MTHLVLIIALACTLLLLVGFLLRDALGGRGRRHISAAAPSYGEIPSRALMDRIFAEDDFSFVAGEGTKQIRRQFLGDRRKLALAWLSQTKGQATAILRSHLTAVGTLDLQPATELKLLGHAILFFGVYAVLRVLVGFYGAFWARSFVKNVLTLAGRLSGLGGSILADAGRTGLQVARSQGHA